MARLAVTAILLTLLVVALCGVLDAEPAASPYPTEESVPNADGAYYDFESVAVPDHDEAVQSNSLPASSAKVPPVDVDQGFLRLPSHRRHHHPCRHGHRHLWWARRHGILRQDVYHFHRHRDGFQAQEKQLAEVRAEPTHGEELREVVLPVAEPDPDSRPDAAVAAEAVQVPAFHGEQEDDDEMARAWWRFRRFHQHHHHRRHHHQDEHEEDDHEQREEVSPVKRFRFHQHHDEEEEPETRSKRFHHDNDDDSDDKDELEEEMARRWIRKALTRSRINHHGRRFHSHHHHHLHFRHRAEDAAGEAGEEENGGVMKWLKDLVNRF